MHLRFRRNPARPRFLWQGVLIILPALLRAGDGFYSLRQDEVVARLQAGQQAQQIADELVQRMAEWLRMELPDAPAVGAAFRLPEDEPLQRLLHSPLVESACLIDSDGQLLYPPSPR